MVSTSVYMRSLRVRINYIKYELYHKVIPTKGKIIGIRYVEVPGLCFGNIDKNDCRVYKSYAIRESIGTRLLKKG